jgi:predicted ATPase/DNA-binding NarL/FixJ family response regulator
MLAERLADRQMLLILDNCEHLIPASAILAHTLLRGCPRLRILATSRESLSITGETLFPVPPLSAPDPHSRPSLADMSRCEAVALFLARAQTVAPGFALTEDNRVAVADLCHRLDGLPLAIELAAPRMRVLAPEKILERLADRFALLSPGSRSAPERQQTLRACVDWSFDLCAKPEQLLWARLSVFVGGFELDAVEGVCADECLPADGLLDLMADLVDKSILDRDDNSGSGAQARYRMLETIREFGEARLIEVEEQAVLRRRHRNWYQRLATQAGAEWISDRQGYWYARVVREHANLRASIEYCLTEPRQVEAALHIMVGLPRLYWWARAMWSEGLTWLDSALAQATAPSGLRARALLLIAWMASWQGDTETVTQRLSESEELALALHDAPAFAFAAVIRGQVAMQHNDIAGMIQVTEEGLTRLPPTADGEPEPAVRLYLLLTLGIGVGLTGDHERARRCYQEILEITEPLGESICRSNARWGIGLIAWRQSDTRNAGHHLQEVLRTARAAGLPDRHVVALSTEVLAWIAGRQQQYQRAATLFGAANTQLTDFGKHLAPILVRDHDACEEQTRRALGDAAFTEAFHQGQALTLDDTLAYALEERPQPASPPPSDTSMPLTRRERQVADLLTQGLSNKEIAGKLVISERTAESHVEHILTKLGFTSRAQIAAWTAEQHTGTSNS